MNRSRQWIAPVLVSLLIASAWALPAGAEDRERDDEERPPVGKGADQRTVGHVLVQTPEASRNFALMQSRGVTFFQVDVDPDSDFQLQSTESSSIDTCVLGSCIETGDFDIVFFRERTDGSTTVTGRYTDVGPESGTVPPHSSYAFVYLTTSGTNPGLRGFEFEYIEIQGGARGQS